MSDIIYTPPASSGGGQNPTTNYIPLNNGTSNFVDSNLFNDLNNNILKSVFNGNDIGLRLDFNNIYCALGDYNANVNGTSFFVDDANSVIKTNYAGNNLGLYLDFSVRTFTIGDIDNNYNGTRFYVDDVNRIISTLTNTGLYGLKLDFVNNIFYFGDFDYNYNGTLLSIDDPNANIFLGNLAADTSGYRYNYLGNGGNNFFHLEVGCNPDGVGLFIDYQNTTNDFVSLYSNGQTSIFSNNNQPLSLNALGTNNNQFILDPVTDKMTFTTGNLNFVGAGLQSGTAGGSSGSHLQIVLNGTTYKIALLNP